LKIKESGRWFLKQEIPIDIKILQIEIVASVETDGRPSQHHSQFRLYIIRNIIADSNPKTTIPCCNPHQNRY